MLPQIRELQILTTEVGIEKLPEIATHYCWQCGLEYCNHCKTSNLVNHPHQLVTLKTYSRSAPADYWKDIAGGKEFTHFCDTCGESISTKISRYMSCARCSKWDVCENCISRSKSSLESHACSGSKQLVWNYYNVKGVDKEYLERQHALGRAQQLRWKKAIEHDRRASAPPAGIRPKQAAPVARKAASPTPNSSSFPLVQPKPGLQSIHTFQGAGLGLPPEVIKMSSTQNLRPNQAHQNFHTFQSPRPPYQPQAQQFQPKQGLQSFHSFQSSTSPVPSGATTPVELPVRPQPGDSQLQRARPSVSPAPPQHQQHTRPPAQSAPPSFQQPAELAEQTGKSSGVGRNVFFGVTKAVVGGVANAAGVGGIEYGISAVQALTNPE